MQNRKNFLGRGHRTPPRWGEDTSSTNPTSSAPLAFDSCTFVVSCAPLQTKILPTPLRREFVQFWFFIRKTPDEKFRGCWPSHLEQFTSRSANCNSLPSDVRLTFEGPPVWLTGRVSEDYLWRGLQIPSSSSSVCSLIKNLPYHYYEQNNFFSTFCARPCVLCVVN